MATKITTTKELTIDLKDTTGEYNRVLRIPNPVDGITRAQVEEALTPAIKATDEPAVEGETATYIPFFYDDYDASVGLTVLGDIEIVEVTKKVTAIQ